MRHALVAALLATSMFSLPTTAHAQAMSAEEATALRAELTALRAKVETLEARLDQASPPPVPVPTPAPAPSSTTEVKWRGAPVISTESGWSFKPRGRILIDAGYVGAPSARSSPALGFTNELRRARLGVEGTIPGGFEYKLEADFASGDVEVTDALLAYEHGPLKLTVGQHNNFQGLEELSSSNDTSFIERAAFTDAFGFTRRVGVSVEYAKDALLLQGGVFTDNFEALDSGNDGISTDGRIVFAPKLGKTQLHLGASAHWRRIGDSVESIRYRQRPLIHNADVRFISTPEMDADSESGFGLEAAVVRGRWHAAAETYWQKVTRIGFADPEFFGGAVEAGLYLTDDTRSYRSGMFRGIKVKNPVGSGGIGAWQVNLRYDHLDLNDEGILGGKQDGYMASLIWNPIDYVRFMVNYARLQYSNAVIPAGGDRSYGVDSFGARAQVVF